MSWQVGLILVVILACVVPWLLAELTRPSRRWLKRLRGIERARLDWQARCIENQCFYRSEK